MNENAMMKKMGRGMAKSAMAKKDMSAKKPSSKKLSVMKMGAVKTSSKPDGVATKGKTKGKMVAMKMGGKTC
jgi:hypothetical protein